MIYLDSALLNLTEAFCRRFQRLTGRTNVWLAFQLTNLSIVVYFVWAGLYVVGSRGHALTRTLIGCLCGVVLYLLTQTIFKVPVETLEASAYSRVARGLRNPRRVRDALLRIAFLTVSLMLLIPAVYAFFYIPALIVPLGYLLVVATTVLLYLLACDPLAPCPGRVTEWIRRLVPSRAQVNES
jgi:hypothetical protein